MGRKKTQQELEDEAERADREHAELMREQRECSHWKAQPSEWYWNGRVREMTCPECGATRFIDDEEL